MKNPNTIQPKPAQANLVLIIDYGRWNYGQTTFLTAMSDPVMV